MSTKSPRQPRGKPIAVPAPTSTATAASVERVDGGRFAPGRSGNPGGRPKAVRELLDRARAAVPAAFDLAEKLVADEKADPRVRLEAARFLTAYGLGAPPKEAPKDPAEDMSDDELREALGIPEPAAAPVGPREDDEPPTSH